MLQTILSYLKSKTVQGILGLVILGILKTQHIDIIGADLMGTLMVLFTGWAGIGARDAIKPIEAKKAA
jgi:hypothetical protein